MNANYKIELMDCENTLLREIADKSLKQKSIAMTYRLAMESTEIIDWGTVNRAIINRWSRAGLERIKKMAHSGGCFEGLESA